jgi:plastocyanin
MLAISRRVGAAVVALALVGWGCNSRLLRPPATVFVDGGEMNVAPSVSTEQRSFPAVLLSFFPSQIALHAGDELRFDMRYNGEPHTVAFGKLVDGALRAVERLGSDADLRAIEDLPELRKIPDVLPRVAEGDPRINRSAAERCFLDKGVPPNSETGGAALCPKRDQPRFDGTQAFFSSGFLPEGEGFRMKLGNDIRPGTYRFMCLVHRAAMTGAIEVRPGDEERPSVSRVKLDGRDEQGVVAAAATTAATDAARRESGPILAGTGQAGQVRGFVSAFVPDRAEARVGQAVTWRFFEMHSISFKPVRRARDGILVQERGGEVRINLDAWRSVGGPRPPPEAINYPPPSGRISIDGGTYSGEGPFSSGIIRAIPPASVRYTLRFGKPGAYSYVCLVHDAMRGQIEVT